MKTFDELTDAELMSLTEEQRDWYIDYACAEAGVPLLPPNRPVAPTNAATTDDMTAYEIAGILFPKRDDAQKVCDLIAVLEHGTHEYISGPSYRKRYEPATGDTVSVTTVRLLSPQKAATMRAVIEAYERTKSTYETEKKEYDAIVTRRNKVADNIYGKIEEAGQRIREHGRIVSEYQRYLKLSQDIKSIALRFLENAHPDAKEIAPELWTPEAPAPTREYALAGEENR